jgi:hypothetical protein
MAQYFQLISKIGKVLHCEKSRGIEIVNHFN